MSQEVTWAEAMQAHRRERDYLTAQLSAVVDECRQIAAALEAMREAKEAAEDRAAIAESRLAVFDKIVREAEAAENARLKSV